MILLVAVNRFDVFVKIPIRVNRKMAFNMLALLLFLIGLSQLILGLVPGYRAFAWNPMGAGYQKAMAFVYPYYMWMSFVALGSAMLLYISSCLYIIIEVCRLAN